MPPFCVQVYGHIFRVTSKGYDLREGARTSNHGVNLTVQWDNSLMVVCTNALMSGPVEASRLSRFFKSMIAKDACRRDHLLQCVSTVVGFGK
jgi:hypothetical protein